MGFELISFASGIVQKQAVGEIVKCNGYTARYGLTLTPEQALELIETRFIALSETGRIEFGGGVIDKIIKEFCDSPFIDMYNYVHTIHELIEMFYYYKNETSDLIGDDDLIKRMKTAYDGICQGSLDLLLDWVLDPLARSLRSGYCSDCQDDGSFEDGEEEDEQ